MRIPTRKNMKASFQEIVGNTTTESTAVPAPTDEVEVNSRKQYSIKITTKDQKQRNTPKYISGN